MHPPAANFPPRLLLASRSPRRRAFLTEHGVPHDAVHPGIDDAALSPTSINAHQFVAALAYLKAAAGVEIARGLPTNYSLVLGADTACVLGRDIIGTPTTPEEARAMILSFIGRTHLVVSGVALIESETGARHIFADEATVRMGTIQPDQLEQYLASELWRGKAGAYNLNDRLQAGWPIEYVGDPTTIMGLPMRALTSRLRKVGFLPCTDDIERARSGHDGCG